MKLNDILNGLTILEATADLNADITDVCYDSRQAVEGGLFVAIAGAATDGHSYIPMVQEKGAACVVCARRASSWRYRATKSTGSMLNAGKPPSRVMSEMMRRT